MSDTSGIRVRAAELVAAFQARGAEAVEADILQPAGPLLDLYGEDIRARAFVTSDPMRGEAMLRPDFTVPVVQRHLDQGADAGVYTYAGEVFRKQPEGSDRPVEYLQVGYERLGGADRADEDAEVFAAFHDILTPLGLVPTTGDIGLLLAAVQGLRTTAARKSALARHLWRPHRFRALLDRYRSPGEKRAPVGSPDSPEIGLRTREDVDARLQALAEDAAAPPLSATEAEMLEALLALRAASGDALPQLRDIAVDLPGIANAVDGFEARLAAFAAKGLDAEHLPFEASHGRTSLEYYDGFVFGFSAPALPDLPPVATGGRYDALTHALGADPALPAIGGVIRPGLLAEWEAGR